MAANPALQANFPVVALTPGEPAGVGPELAALIAPEPRDARLVLIADPDLLRERGGMRADLPTWRGREDSREAVSVLPVPLARPSLAGRLEPANAGYVLATLERAVAGCLAGEFDALVTGPVHKGVINDAGVPFTGHTEFLAERAGTAQPVMLLAAGTLRVALATIHLPLARVPNAITRERLIAVLRVLAADLRARFGIARPRIRVCGLNPHAGESGHLGREEIDVIAPTLDTLRAEGLVLEGPVPADTAFLPESLAETDAILAMYHDQGLPVLKHHDFAHAVNVTLGLPFIRTSVDHGTALELAGSGRADPSSLRAALDLALAMIATRAKT